MLNKDEIYCTNCGIHVWGKVKEYSKLHHGVILCYACQKKDKKD